MVNELDSVVQSYLQSRQDRDRNRILELHLDLIRSVVNSTVFRPHRHMLQDIFQEVCAWLLTDLARYDPERDESIGRYIAAKAKLRTLNCLRPRGDNTGQVSYDSLAEDGYNFAEPADPHSEHEISRVDMHDLILPHCEAAAQQVGGNRRTAGMTGEKLAEAYLLFAVDGVAQAELASRYGVSKMTISKRFAQISCFLQKKCTNWSLLDDIQDI